MSAKIGFKVDLKGPVLRGAGSRIMRSFMTEATNDVAQDGVNEVQMQLDRVLQHPTGFYRSRIQTRNLGTSSLITDGGVIYGPWLEGVGSRNATTRFKGYSTFRRVAPRLQRKVPQLVAPALRRAVGRLNG